MNSGPRSVNDEIRRAGDNGAGNFTEGTGRCVIAHANHASAGILIDGKRADAAGAGGGFIPVKGETECINTDKMEHFISV